MNILFVCTGNTCRSPMAEGIFRKIISDENLKDINVTSAGISANNISKATKNAVDVCNEINVDLSKHISKSIFDININNIDKFVVMTNMHREMLLSLGINKDKIYVLGNQIDDPYGGDISIYRKCRDQIYDALNKFIKDIFKK